MTATTTKKTKKLVMASYFFAPMGRADGVLRTFLCRYLSELGWGIEVITCRNRQTLLQSLTADPSLLKHLEGTGVRIRELWTIPWGGAGELLHAAKVLPCPFVNWAWTTSQSAGALMDGPAVVYAILPPWSNAVVAGALEQAAPGSRLVLDFRDNCYDLPRDVVARAALCVFSSERSQQEMCDLYRIERSRCFVMYGGYPDLAPVEVAPRAPGDDRVRIVFTGSLTRIQDPFLLERALKRCEALRPGSAARFDVKFYGPRNYYVRLLEKTLTHSQFMGYVPYAEAARAVAGADLAFTSIAGEAHRFMIPSKLFHYVQQGRPLLATGPKGALQELMEGEGLGLYSGAGDAEALARNLLRLLDEPGLLQGFHANVARVAPRFHMRHQAERLSEKLDALWGQGLGGGTP